MATNLTISINNDTQDLPLGSSGVIWTTISPANDKLIFSSGSDTVTDGQPIPSSFQLSQAGVVLNGFDVVIPHYFLADLSANLLRECTLMGNADKRYVLAFDFDGATTSEPVLEMWDNTLMNSVNATTLGAGTPSSSWFRGITTTDGSPGAGWSGNRLAGSTNGNFLWLNNQNGALSVAKVLYCNLYAVVPSIQVAGGGENPIIVVKYTTS